MFCPTLPRSNLSRGIVSRAIFTSFLGQSVYLLGWLQHDLRPSVVTCIEMFIGLRRLIQPKSM